MQRAELTVRSRLELVPERRNVRHDWRVGQIRRVDLKHRIEFIGIRDGIWLGRSPCKQARRAPIDFPSTLYGGFELNFYGCRIASRTD